MASSSYASSSSSPSPGVPRRGNRPSRDAPYLTHVTRYHDQVTLIPPENAGRVRKAKKKKSRPYLFHTASDNSSSACLLTLRPGSPARTTSSNGGDSIQRTRSSGRASPVRVTYQDWEIPDYPPPSFEEAIATSSSHSSSLSLLTSSHSTTPLNTTDAEDSNRTTHPPSNGASTSELSSPIIFSSLDTPSSLNDREHSFFPPTLPTPAHLQTPELMITEPDSVTPKITSVSLPTASPPSQQVAERPYNSFHGMASSDLRNHRALMNTSTVTPDPPTFNTTCSSQLMSSLSSTNTTYPVNSHLAGRVLLGSPQDTSVECPPLNCTLFGIATESYPLEVPPKGKGKERVKEESSPDELLNSSTFSPIESSSQSTLTLECSAVPVLASENCSTEQTGSSPHISDLKGQNKQKSDHLPTSQKRVEPRIAPPIPQRPVQIKKRPPPIPPRRLSVASSNDLSQDSRNSTLTLGQTRRKPPPPPPPRKNNKPVNNTLENSVSESSVLSISSNLSNPPLIGTPVQTPHTRLLSSSVDSEPGPSLPPQASDTTRSVPPGDASYNSIVDHESLLPSIPTQGESTSVEVTQVNSESQTLNNSIERVANRNGVEPPVRARRPLPPLPISRSAEPFSDPSLGRPSHIEDMSQSLNPNVPVSQLLESASLRPPDDTGAVSPSSEIQGLVTPDISSVSSTLNTLEPRFAGYTELDLILDRLENSQEVANGSMYDDLLALSDVIGPARESSSTHTDSSNVLEHVLSGRIEVDRRRTTKDGRVKLKLSLLGLSVDKCGICLSQFKKDELASLLPQCQHAFHDKCIRRWLARNGSCPLCRAPLE